MLFARTFACTFARLFARLSVALPLHCSAVVPLFPLRCCSHCPFWHMVNKQAGRRAAGRRWLSSFNLLPGRLRMARSVVVCPCRPRLTRTRFPVVCFYLPLIPALFWGICVARVADRSGSSPNPGRNPGPCPAPLPPHPSPVGLLPATPRIPRPQPAATQPTPLKSHAARSSLTASLPQNKMQQLQG